ncbi:hypothetical protein NMY22_g16789 [Coprinellus aureogranulatus]|nr:hypothetical protein NMY22_g16789 [Coprinellus aureogranulatus]
MLYAHLSVLYSLLIAGTVSIAKHELTKADSMFVLICVASPASIYLWYLTIRSFFNTNVFPIEHSNKKKAPSQSWEVQITRLITFGSFAYTVAYLVITFVPSKVIKFAQPACDREYGTDLWFNLAWMLPVALQMVIIIILYYFSWGLLKLWTLRSSYIAPAPVFIGTKGDSDWETLDKLSANTGQVDLITWTETVLNDQFPDFMNSTLLICIFSILQLSGLPTVQVWPIDSKDLGTWVILTFGLFRHRPHHDTNWVKEYTIRAAISLLFAGYYVARFMFPLIPTSPDWVIFFVACTAAAWCRRNYTGSSMRIFLPIFLVLFGLFVLAANILAIIIGDPKAFASDGQIGKQPDGSDFSYLVFNIASLALWIVSWLATSAWPFKRSLTWDKLNKALFRRAHLFKCGWIILGPHILWIQSSNNASPNRSNEMPFGQIFALIVAIVTVFTLLDEAKDVKKEVWWAFIKSDPMPFDEDERPKHYAPLRYSEEQPRLDSMSTPEIPANDVRPAKKLKTASDDDVSDAESEASTTAPGPTYNDRIASLLPILEAHNVTPAGLLLAIIKDEHKQSPDDAMRKYRDDLYNAPGSSWSKLTDILEAVTESKRGLKELKRWLRAETAEEIISGIMEHEMNGDLASDDEEEEE